MSKLGLDEICLQEAIRIDNLRFNWRIEYSVTNNKAINTFHAQGAAIYPVHFEDEYSVYLLHLNRAWALLTLHQV